MKQSVRTSTPLRMTAYAAVLAASFGAAYAVGAAVEPVVARSEAPAEDTHHTTGSDRSSEIGPGIDVATVDIP